MSIMLINRQKTGQSINAYLEVHYTWDLSTCIDVHVVQGSLKLNLGQNTKKYYGFRIQQCS